MSFLSVGSVFGFVTSFSHEEAFFTSASLASFSYPSLPPMSFSKSGRVISKASFNLPYMMPPRRLTGRRTYFGIVSKVVLFSPTIGPSPPFAELTAGSTILLSSLIASSLTQNLVPSIIAITLDV